MSSDEFRDAALTALTSVFLRPGAQRVRDELAALPDPASIVPVLENLMTTTLR